MHLHPTTFAALQRRVAGCFDFAITLHTPYKLCDYKPAYGEIFAPELSGYDFWGYGDMDLVFGDLRAYFTEDKLQKYDKFYAFGHLSLYRNTPENNAVYRQPVGMDYRKAFTTREIAVFDEINGISAKYKALGLPFYDRQDYADITKASDRLAITDVGITADNQLHPNYTEQIFYCDHGRVFRDAYYNGQWLTDEFVYIHISSRRLPLHIDPAADTYFIGKTGYEPKTGVTTRADIALYNALDPAADEKQRRHRQRLDLRRKNQKRFYPYKGTHLQMNILHLQLSGGPGGIVSLCRDINKHSAHHNFFYFLFEGGSIADEIAAQGGTVQVATGAKNHPLKAATDLVRYCKEQQIDVVVDHSGSPYTRFVHIYAARRLKKVRFLLYLHSTPITAQTKGSKNGSMPGCCAAPPGILRGS